MNSGVGHLPAAVCAPEVELEVENNSAGKLEVVL
jgi:hypothetical protein